MKCIVLGFDLVWISQGMLPHKVTFGLIRWRREWRLHRWGNCMCKGPEVVRTLELLYYWNKVTAALWEAFEECQETGGWRARQSFTSHAMAFDPFSQSNGKSVSVSLQSHEMIKPVLKKKKKTIMISVCKIDHNGTKLEWKGYWKWNRVVALQ